jgi:hypothetical protein
MAEACDMACELRSPRGQQQAKQGDHGLSPPNLQLVEFGERAEDRVNLSYMAAT